MDNSYSELNEILQACDESVLELSRLGKEYAYADAEYYKNKNIRCVQLKADGLPVTQIQQIVKGEESVNPYYLKSMLAEVEYKSEQEHLNVLKMRVKSLREQTNREYYA